MVVLCMNICSVFVGVCKQWCGVGVVLSRRLHWPTWLWKKTPSNYQVRGADYASILFHSNPPWIPLSAFQLASILDTKGNMWQCKVSCQVACHKQMAFGTWRRVLAIARGVLKARKQNLFQGKVQSTVNRNRKVAGINPLLDFASSWSPIGPWPELL